MHIEIITTTPQFAALRADWNRLASGQPLNHWEWHAAWWDAFGESMELAIVTVRVDERVVAIAPWCIQTHSLTGRSLRFLGSGKACTDYQRILVDPAFQIASLELITTMLVSSGKNSPALAALDSIELDGVRADEPTIRQLLNVLTENDYEVHTREIESTWVAPTAASWPEFEQGLSKELRRKVRKALSRAADPDIRFHVTQSADDLQRIWPSFVRLHQQRFQNRADDAGCFSDARFEQFLLQATLALLPSGQAEIVWCEQAGTPFVAQLYLLNNDTAFMYQSGFDPAFAALEPGHLLYTHVFQRLIERGIRQLDFLRGNEPYKAKWNAAAVPMYRYRCVPPRFLPRLRQEALNVGRTIKQLAGNYF